MPRAGTCRRRAWRRRPPPDSFAPPYAATATPAPSGVRLSSTRVRSALRLLAGLRQGVPLTEQLGYQAERLLHDRGADVLIGEARAYFSA